MTVDQILTLINAGYTKEEISAMSTAAPVDPAPAAPETPEQKPTPDEQTQGAALPAKPADPKPQAAPEAPKQQPSDAERILAALGNLAKGVDVPPAHELSIEEKLGNTILAAMGVKPKEE